MEIESEDGTPMAIERDSSTEIGRRPGLGLRRSSPPDRTVSRRHLSLRLAGGDSEDEPRILFEVIGRNPVVVCGSGGGRSPRFYRNSEKGELRDGDRLSLSLKNLSFWVLRRRGAAPAAGEQEVFDAVARRKRRTSERKKKEGKTAIEEEEEEEAVNGDLEQELAALDASQIDPIKEFGFLVKGHEFDRFPRHKIRSIRDWNWFLDDDDDEHEGIKGNRRGKKNKKGDDCEDEEWAEVEDAVEVRSASRAMYSTRSNTAKKPKKEEEEDDDDDDDGTLGGFIVNDGGEEDEGELEEEEEEEEFDGEDDEEDE